MWCQFSYPCNRLQTSLTSFYPHNNTQWLFPWRPFNFWKPLNLSKVLIFRPKHWCFSKIIIVWRIIWLILLFVQSRVNRLGGVPEYILEKQACVQFDWKSSCFSRLWKCIKKIQKALCAVTARNNQSHVLRFLSNT